MNVNWHSRFEAVTIISRNLFNHYTVETGMIIEQLA